MNGENKWYEFKTGKILYISQFVDDKKNGLTVSYDTTGSMLDSVYYKNNYPVGNIIERSYLGKKDYSAKFVNGVVDGEFIKWHYDTQEKEIETFFKNGLPDGKWLEWYKNGNKK